MLVINEHISIPLEEIDFSAIRAQGPGGQNVNKVSSAIHLRFDVQKSSLSDSLKRRILAKRDRHLNKDGVLVLKAQNARSQTRNKEEALRRLREIILEAMVVQKPRRATKPSFGSVQRRLKTKARRSGIKSTRGKVSRDD